MTDSTIGLYDSNGDAIIEYDQFDSTDIRYFYVSTGFGSTGYWVVNANKDGFDYNGDPVENLGKAQNRLSGFMADNLSAHGGFVTSVGKKLDGLVARMTSKFNKLAPKCDAWPESEAEDDDDLRYDRDDPCKAATQLPKAFLKWSNVYNVNCRDPSKTAFPERILSDFNKIEEKLKKKLRC